MAPTEESPLTFHWPNRREISLALPFFLVVSLLAHAATFYLFQIEYPASTAVTAPPAEAIYWSASSMRDVQLWLNAEDPSLMLRPREAVPAQSFEIPYQPFFNTARAEPQQVGDENTPVAFPQGFTTSELVRSNREQKNAPSPAQPLFSRVEFSENILNRAPGHLPSIPLQRPSETILYSTKFFIGISSEGRICFVFLQTSSGNSSIDELAEAYLSSLQCLPAKGGVKWGFATFHWGVDAMREVERN